MSPSYGTKLGWLGTGFLVGIGLHSLWPYQRIEPVLLSVVVALAVVIACVAPSRYGSTRWIGLILVSVCVGIWRFDATLPRLPYGMRPFIPQGLAHVVASRAPASQHGVEHGLWRIRTELHDRVNQIFPRDEAALLRGILYGDRDLGKEWQGRFRRAGCFTSLLFPIKHHYRGCPGDGGVIGDRFSRRAAFAVFSGVLVLFVIFVQPSASVIRASSMGWL